MKLTVSRIMAILLVVLAATTGWFGYVAMATSAPSRNSICEPGGCAVSSGGCTDDIFLDGTTPVDHPTTGAASIVGTAGQDPAAFINSLTTTSRHLCLEPGTYSLRSTLTITTDEILEGQGEDVILTQPNSQNLNPMIAGTSISKATLTNFKIDFNGANNPTSAIGINFQTTSYVTVKYLTLINGVGISLDFSGTPVSRNDHANVLYNHVNTPIATANDQLTVVSDYSIVIGNRVVGVTKNTGLNIYESDYATVTANEVETTGSDNSLFGMSVESCRFCIISNNRVTGTSVSGGGAALRMITEHDNGSPKTSANNLVIGNSFVTAATAIQLLETNNDTVQSNFIVTATTGIGFPTSASPQAAWTKIFDNVFNAVTTPVADPGGASNHILFRGDTAYNPVGKIATPFGTSTVGPIVGSSANPIASTTYTVTGDNFFNFTSSGGTGVVLTIKDTSGNCLVCGAATVTNVFVPFASTISFGAFSVAPTVKIYGD